MMGGKLNIFIIAETLTDRSMVYHHMNNQISGSAVFFTNLTKITKIPNLFCKPIGLQIFIVNINIYEDQNVKELMY